MIILDTNVISELMKKVPDVGVVAWFAGLEPQPLMITAITVAELRYGVSVLPEGKRRTQLDSAITAMIDEEFDACVLDFGRQAAEAYGILAARFRKEGIGVGQSDMMIAAIALVNEETIATRNERDFEHCGVEIVNPFAFLLVDE